MTDLSEVERTAMEGKRGALYPPPHNPSHIDMIDVARHDAFEDGFKSGREYSKQHEEELRRDRDEPGHLLAELLWAVKQARGFITDTDLERVYRAEERAEVELAYMRARALAENGDSDAERACENCGNGGTRFLWGGGASCEGCFEEFQQWLRLGDRRPGA